MYRNVSGQTIALFAFTTNTGEPKTGDAGQILMYVAKDFGTPTGLTDTTPTEMSSTNAPGWYKCDVSQAETDAHALLFTGKSSTSGVTVVGQRVYTTDWALKKNKPLSAYEFLMTDSTNHNPATGKTVTVTRSIDGGAFAATTAGTATEITSPSAVGIYKIDLSASDLNGTVVTLRMAATTCDDLFTTLILEP